MQIKSAPIGNVILIPAIAGQGERVQLIEHPSTPKGRDLRSGRKTALALPPLLA